MSGTRIIVRMERETKELTVNLPTDFTDEGLREIIASELNCDTGRLQPLIIERTPNGITLREEAPFG